jgi:KDO2-lipid IV(A) lauroyltransferase
MPFSFLYFLSDITAFFAQHILQYRKAVIIKNLRNAFPEKSMAEINKIKTLYYKNLTDVAFETFKLISISEETLTKRAKILNIEVLNNYYDKGITVIATTSHLCNWEWILNVNSIHLKARVHAVYQEIRNQFFEKLMLNIRSRFGAIPIEKNQLFRESLKKRSTPHVVALVADQSPPLHDENVIWTKFLNQDTVFYSGMTRLANSFKWPIIYVDMRRIKRGYYEIEFLKICDIPEKINSTKIIETYANLLEESIRKAPHCWLWSHKRWKRQKINN